MNNGRTSMRFLLLTVLVGFCAANALDSWPNDSTAPPDWHAPRNQQYGGRWTHGRGVRQEKELDELALNLKHDDSSIQVLGFAKQKAALQDQLAKLQHEVDSMTPQNAEQATQQMEQQDSQAQRTIEHINSNAENAEQHVQQTAALQSMWMSTQKEQAQEHEREKRSGGFNRLHSNIRGASHGGGAAGGGHGGFHFFAFLCVAGGAYYVWQKRQASSRHVGYDNIGGGSGGGSSFQMQSSGSGVGAAAAPDSTAKATSASSPNTLGL